MNLEGMPPPVTYLERQIAAAEERLSLRLAAIELTWKLQHEADEKARELFARQLGEWRIEVNNVREQIATERNQFATAPALEAVKERSDASRLALGAQFEALLQAKGDALANRIAPLEARVLTQTGAAESKQMETSENQWLIGVVIGAAGIIVGVILRLAG